MARSKQFDEAVALDKAIQLFWHKGYNGISTQEITEALAISKSSMYGTYRSKMDWYVAALEKYGNNIASETTRRLQQATVIKKEIRSILSDLVKEALADADYKGCFMVNSCVELAPHDKQIATIVIQHRRKMEKAFVNALKKGIAERELPGSIDVTATAAFICTCISGIQTDAKYLRDKKYFNGIVEGIMKLLD